MTPAERIVEAYRAYLMDRGVGLTSAEQALFLAIARREFDPLQDALERKRKEVKKLTEELSVLLGPSGIPRPRAERKAS